MRIAVIGMGAMGLPMALRLNESVGLDVVGYDRNEPRRQQAEASGLRTATTTEAAMQGAGIVLLAVREASQANAVLLHEGAAVSGLEPGSTVILTSTIGADAARDIADVLDAAGIAVVDAPISGGPGRAAAGDLLILASGPSAALESARPVLGQLSSTLTVVGDRVGEAQLAKVINQLLAGVHIAAAAEAIALAVGVGLDPRFVVETLTAGAGTSFMLKDRGPRMLEAIAGDPEVRSRVDIFVKDMGLVTALAARANVTVPVATAAGQLYGLAESAGLGTHDDSTIVTVLLGHGQAPAAG